ncbi:MAG TPA: hypothetical protein VK400_20285 [Pyrinomonadaceae bacterium]|nr:hypothetical protein [Pyrinomonadaceae bacterium]
MMKKSKILRFISLSIAAAGFLLAAGSVMPASGQVRDPFQKLGVAKPRDPNAKTTTVVTKEGKTIVKPIPAAPAPVVPPAIQERINYYKRMREQAVASNQPIPKVTSVLTLDEMAVTGIFRTPRGYAAMVEAKPINLSYTIYPGEKFFDGQLVAIEENKLVFRRVTKWTNGKFIASEESKSLRQYTVEQEVNGTAPVETTTTAKTETNPAATQTTAQTTSPTSANTAENKTQPVTPAPTQQQQIISPLDEMARQPATENSKEAAKKPSTDKTKKGRQKSSSGNKAAERKPVKVADNKQQQQQ